MPQGYPEDLRFSISLQLKAGSLPSPKVAAHSFRGQMLSFLCQSKNFVPAFIPRKLPVVTAWSVQFTHQLLLRLLQSRGENVVIGSTYSTHNWEALRSASTKSHGSQKETGGPWEEGGVPWVLAKHLTNTDYTGLGQPWFGKNAYPGA